MKKLYILAIISLLIHPLYSQSQSRATIAFYNVENLFDTLDNTVTRKDPDFVPNGKYQWTSEKYEKKIKNMASIIAEIGDSDGPEVLALAEVENKDVLNDLIKSPKLSNKNYKIIHFDSKDFRGIDVALLYKSTYLKPINSTIYSIKDPENPKFITRDILLVSGLIKNDTVHFLVNHWPSRRGGKEEKRALAAQKAKSIVDSLQSRNNKSKIIITGDFNDNPNDASLTKHLNAKETSKKLKKLDLFNTTAPIYNDSNGKTGTLSYKGEWFLFDQFIISKSLLGKKGVHYIKNSIQIYENKNLRYQTGKYKGYLFTTNFGRKYIGGYSDHLPVYLYLD